jgi:hypothetical protein
MLSLFTSRRKLLQKGFLAIGLMVCIAGIVTVIWYQKMIDCFKERPPLHSFVVVVDRNHQTQLTDAARDFADKYGFQFDIAYYTPQRDSFRIDMIRNDVEVVLWNTIDLEKFYVNFYNYNCIHPTVASDIDELFNELKIYLSKVPNVIITEEK